MENETNTPAEELNEVTPVEETEVEASNDEAVEIPVDEADEENQDEVPPEDEISEEKADDLLKLASENKSVFVGLKPNSNPIAKKIASKFSEFLRYLCNRRSVTHEFRNGKTCCWR